MRRRYELDDFRRATTTSPGLGFELRPFDEAWLTMQALRDGYVGPLATLFHVLLPPSGSRALPPTCSSGSGGG